MQENMNNTQPTPEGTVVESAPAKVSSFAGLFEVFVKPSEFFSRLKDDPKIIVPYLFILITSVVFGFLIVNIFTDFIVKSPEVVERLQGNPLPPQALSFIKISIVAFPALAMLLLPVVTAALAMFWGNFVFAGKAKFSQLMSTSLYAQIVYMLGFILTCLFILIKGQVTYPFSLGGLVIGHGLESLEFIALSKIDIFHIWSIIVLGFGFAKVYNFSSNKGILLAVLSSGLLSILHIIYAAVRSMI